MAIPVARVHLAMAHAALPALLPTPPKWKMMPLLPTPPCAVILPIPSPPKPSHADAVERWDAHKVVKPASPASSPGSGKSTAAGSPGRASSCSRDRWDSNKKTSTASSSSSASQSQASSGDKWGSNKRRPVNVSRASSAERWDAHKKPRPPQAGGIDDDGQSSNDMPPLAFYAGPGFLASPEPSMLPMPSSSLMVRVAA
ncbi:unnamed protein product [Urochloa decumbens]|uniref:Uncharacterized protein n=1 Tax=Urochloa decumbens TaxID=240449 RepID=A0ABC8VUN4_9POAL